jgi:hypothetical protein
MNGWVYSLLEVINMTQKLVTTFVLLLFLLIAFALLGAFSSYFEILTRQLI